MRRLSGLRRRGSEETLPPYREYERSIKSVDLPEPPEYKEVETKLLPGRMNGYYKWMSLGTILIGPTKEDIHYTVKDSLLGNLLSVLLKEGDNGRIIAKIVGPQSNYKPKKFRVELEEYNDVTIAPLNTGIFTSPTNATYTFSLGKETFEWRPSRGREVRELGGKLSHGWKLVRLGCLDEATGGNRQERKPGYSSDGMEIVALFAFSAYLNFSKAFSFRFMGPVGSLGKRGELVAFTSAMQLRFLQQRAYMSSSASTSSAGAGCAAVSC
ncbi:hypothetical protein TRICI_001019 [Trichomonascus ciferrii]|uniref:Phospholipid scramblase n=1 Tax=Trichomonascus ciferrii TaxID=44093 RepID=A0A642V9S9_9ASCO|nr:hypothetical protein TRICI_001019 [Trichomonascus ciferrii]